MGRRNYLKIAALAAWSLGACDEPLATSGSTTGAQPAGSAGAGAANASGNNPGSTSATPDFPERPGASAGARDHCVDGWAPHPTDATMAHGPFEYYPPGRTDPGIVDLTLQPEVLQWMEDNLWAEGHFEWHAIRMCRLPGFSRMSKVDICSYTGLVPADQNCQTDGDGYQFLVFHRYLIQTLKQLWPSHADDFEGFEKFPASAEDVPPQWRSAWTDWPPDVLEAGRIGDEIDKPENLARFPNEGVLGFWLQCNFGQRLRSPPNDMPLVGLHFALHAKWARPGNTRHGVNNTEHNVENYMFYKLHGWIDNVWEKYRRAKGLSPTDPKLQSDLTAHCRELDLERAIIERSMQATGRPSVDTALPRESGFFHERVRPILESNRNLCSGCHAESGAMAMLRLGGSLSSREIVDGLVDRPSRNGGQFKLVVPGDPERSWLYLKASAAAESAGCVPSASARCITGAMPPTAAGPTLTAAELATLRQWILDGAEGPPPR